MASNSSSAAADPRDIEMSVQRGEGEWQPRDGSSSSGSGSGNAGTTTDEATSSDSSLNITSEDSLVEPQGGGVVAVANGRAGRGKSVCIDSLDELGLDDVPGHVVPGNGVDGTTNGGEGAAPAAPAVVSQGKARVIPVGERRTYCIGHGALTPTRPSSYLTTLEARRAASHLIRACTQLRAARRNSYPHPHTRANHQHLQLSSHLTLTTITTIFAPHISTPWVRVPGVMSVFLRVCACADTCVRLAAELI